jgi:predicted MFS family arabinose efflux permease
VRGRVFGFAETTRTLAWIFSPPLGGILAQSYGYRWMFVAAAIAAALAAVIFMIMTRVRRAPDETREGRTDFASLKSSMSQMAVLAVSGGLITWILITDAARDSALKISFELMPVYLTDIGGLTKSDIGLLDGIFGIAWVLTSYPAGWLVDKTSERLCIVLGIVAQLLSQVAFLLATGFTGFAFSWILLGIGGATLEPAFSSLIARGQVWNNLGPRAPFMITVLLGSLALYPAWRKLVVLKGEGEGMELSGANGR